LSPRCAAVPIAARAHAPASVSTHFANLARASGFTLLRALQQAILANAARPPACVLQLIEPADRAAGP
jgi:hypothetical protein